MNSKVKGLLKGLRYISQIFEANNEEDEEEMNIGFPTDVKHVAHIGWDGPSVTAPSWMNEFRNAPLSSLGAEAMRETSRTNSSNNVRIVQGSPLRDSRKTIVESASHTLPESPPSKPSRCHVTSTSGIENPASESPSMAPRQSRRNKSSSESTTHPDQSEASDGQSDDSHRRSRRPSRAKEPVNGGESGPGGPEVPGIPRQVRKKKKPKGSSGEGSGSRLSSSSRPRRSTGSSESDMDFRKPETVPSLKTVEESE